MTSFEPPPCREWQPGQVLQLLHTLHMPRVPEHCADPQHVITDEERVKDAFTIWQSDRVKLLRLMDGGTRTLCRHASGAHVLIAALYLAPVTE
ncbi:MAG: hypothetical protein V4662_11880 [Verrucomicrobiota bacterium]